MKKIGAVVAACALCIGVLAGCSGSESSDTKTESGTETTETTQEAEAPAEAVEAVEQQTVYVTPEWLNSALAGEQEGYENVLVAEVVYDDPDADATYKEAHIPGAIYVTDTDVEDAVGDIEQPYNLLSADDMEQRLLARGITKDTKLVLYGADISGTGRVAYGCLWAGVEDVKILNGGLDAWTAAGYDTESTANDAVPAEDFGCTVPAHPEYWTSMEDAKDRVANDDNFKLVSIRGEAEWLGTTSGYSYIDRAGEPEGAVWGKGCETPYDVADFTNADGTVKDFDGVTAVWEDCDFTLENHLSFYCGTGWRATVPFLVLYENGYRDISVYDGGWYEWQLHDDNPVQVGDPASADCQHVTVADLPTDKAAKD